MTDIVTGRITPAEAKRTQKEVNERIKVIEATMKTLEQFVAFQELSLMVMITDVMVEVRR